MPSKTGRCFLFVLGLVSASLCYGHGHGFWGYGHGYSGYRQGYWGQNVIFINPSVPVGGYYNGYAPYPYYNPYEYYPRYRCITVPRCYPSGDCNYQNQECNYY
jgi:hypothetical protein